MPNYNEELSQIDVSVEEKDKLVAEVIRYVLFKNHQTSGCPIKRDELTQITTKNYRQRSLPGLVINEAIEKLSKIFGYELKELQRSRPSSNRHGAASQQEMKTYVLMSQLPPDIYSKYVENKETSHLSGFTFAVIGVVHLAGGKISEENLWHQLKRMGLNDNNENHLLFGGTKQTLETLVQHRYLLKEKTNSPEGNIFMYELAERSLDAPFNAKMKDYIAQIVNRDTAAGEAD